MTTRDGATYSSPSCISDPPQGHDASPCLIQYVLPTSTNVLPIPTRSYPALEHGGKCPFAGYSWHIPKQTEDPGRHPGSCLEL